MDSQPVSLCVCVCVCVCVCMHACVCFKESMCLTGTLSLYTRHLQTLSIITQYLLLSLANILQCIIDHLLLFFTA